MKQATRLRASSLSSVTAAMRSPPRAASSGVRRGASGGVFEEQVVGGDVGDFGEPDDDVGAGGDAGVLIAADLAGVAADLGGEVGLGPAVLLPQFQDALAKRHDRASLLVLTEPF